MVLAVLSILWVVSTYFVRNTAYYSYAGAIYMYQTNSLSVIFIGNTAARGGAIFMYRTNLWSVTNSALLSIGVGRY